MTIALQGNEQSAGNDGKRQADREDARDRLCRGVVLSACAQHRESQGNEGNLSQQLGGHIDDDRAESEGSGHSLQNGSSRAESDSTELREWQHFRRRVPHHARPDEDSQAVRGWHQDVPRAAEKHERCERVET